MALPAERDRGLDDRAAAVAVADRQLAAGTVVGDGHDQLVTAHDRARLRPRLTDSYHQFAEGYWLRRDAMFWFWDQYTTDPEERTHERAGMTVREIEGASHAVALSRPEAVADVVREAVAAAVPASLSSARTAGG